MGKKILIVEDYEDSRGFLSFLLKSQGYQVNEAGDGLEAVESIKKDCPDLILMDIAMPHMDGLTATRIIRISYCAEDVPIIALTAFGHSFYNEAIEAGCNDLIDKPIKFDELEPVLNQYLSS